MNKDEKKKVDSEDFSPGMVVSLISNKQRMTIAKVFDLECEVAWITDDGKPYRNVFSKTILIKHDN